MRPGDTSAKSASHDLLKSAFVIVIGVLLQIVSSPSVYTAVTVTDMDDQPSSLLGKTMRYKIV